MIEVLNSRSIPLVDLYRPDCRNLVTTEDARVIVQALEAAGVKRYAPLRYDLPMWGFLQLLPALPNDDAVCFCG
jgi:hypothetical protein